MGGEYLLDLALEAQTIKAAHYAVGNGLALDNDGIKSTGALINEGRLDEDPGVNALQYHETLDELINDLVLLDRKRLRPTAVTD